MYKCNQFVEENDYCFNCPHGVPHTDSCAEKTEWCDSCKVDCICEEIKDA